MSQRKNAMIEETMARTFIPETSIPVSNLSFPDFNEVKHADTQTDVV